MYTQVKSSNGITLMPIDTKLLGDRKIFIEGNITETSAVEFIKKLLILVREDREAPIKIMINTEGGEINSGMLIYDVIQSCRTPLEMYCLGKAFSMGAVIFAGGKPGKRFLLENSEIMIHEPLLGDRVGGSSSSIKYLSESLLEIKEKINGIWARHTGRTIEEIDEATEWDHFFTAEEAIEFGLADKIVGFEDLV